MSREIWKPPAGSPLEDQAVPRERMFWIACGVWATVMAGTVGAIAVVQFAFGLGHFGGIEYLPRVVALSIVRGHAPGIAAIAPLLALVTWAHRLDIETVRKHRARMSKQVALATLACFPVAIVLTGGASLITGTVFYDLGWRAFAFGTRETIQLRDIGEGLAFAFVNVLVLGVPLGVALPASTALRLSLPVKIVSLWVALLVCRVLLALIMMLVSE